MYGGSSKHREAARIHYQVLRETLDSSRAALRDEGCDRLFLGGRDVWMLAVLCERRHIPYLFVPELSRPVADHKENGRSDDSAVTLMEGDLELWKWHTTKDSVEGIAAFLMGEESKQRRSAVKKIPTTDRPTVADLIHPYDSTVLPGYGHGRAPAGDPWLASCLGARSQWP